MAECALAKNGRPSIGGEIMYGCASKCKTRCDVCKRGVCVYHLCVITYCAECKDTYCKIHGASFRSRLPICDECIIYNVQYTIDNKTQFVQNYLDPTVVNSILQCYSGTFTKSCKK